MTVRWVVGTWGEACGPRPSGGGDAGGVVSIEQRGDELSIRGDSGAYDTEQCWQMHASLSPQSHSASDGVWKTTCRTAPTDPRQEILQTTLSLAGDVLSLQESGQYQFVVGAQTCAASSGRWRTYRRLPSEPAAPVAAPPPASPCAQPGAPERLEVRPSRKLMRAGESFHFRSSVFDARGCSLGTPVVWSLVPQTGTARIEAGRLSVAADAPDGALQVIATAASQSVRVSVDVVSGDRYAALLATGQFNADGASADAASVRFAGGSLGAGAATESEARSDRKWTFVALVSAIAFLFALIGAWLLRRAQRTAAVAAPRARPVPAGRTLLEIPSERKPAPRPSKLEATRLEPAQAPAAKPATVCPVCGTLYEARAARVCPKDGAQLLPINA